MNKFEINLQVHEGLLSEKELQLAQYLLEHQELTRTMSLQEISAKTGISTATISRFAKKLGFESFQELRFSLTPAAQNWKTRMFEEINENDNSLEVAQKIFSANIDALSSTSELLQQEQLEQAASMLAAAETIGFFGLGASNIVALDGYHKFLRTEKKITYNSDFHMQLMAITRMKPMDVAIIISHSGTDKNALALAEAGRNSGVKIIVITSTMRTPLAKMGTIVFQAVAEEMEFRSEAIHAMIAQISLMDTLFVLTTIHNEQDDAEVLQKIRQTIQKTRQ